MSLQEKEAVVAGLNESFTNTSAAFLVHYQGCSCEEITGVRRKLRENGAQMVVVKNTLARRAVSEAALEGLAEHLVGPTAIVWAKEDPVQPAKVLSEFAKEKDSFEVKGAVVDGAVVTASDVDALAKMPSKQELQAKLLALLNAPATQLLRTMNAPAEQLVRLLGAWKDKIEE